VRGGIGALIVRARGGAGIVSCAVAAWRARAAAAALINAKT